MIIAPSPEIGIVSERVLSPIFVSIADDTSTLASCYFVYGRPSLYRNYGGLIGEGYIKRERPRANTLSLDLTYKWPEPDTPFRIYTVHR